MIRFRAIKLATYAAMLGFSAPVLLAGDMTVQGNVTATTFAGSGAGLTGVLKTEIDPVVNSLNADKWCKADASGTVINCNQDAPVTFQQWVPKTGQTTCRDGAGVTRSCNGTGEDAEYQMGGRAVVPADRDDWHPSFRVNPRFRDNNNGTVSDNLTGLVWLKNANCIADNLGFDKDGTADDGGVTWQHGLDFVRGMNIGSFDCGDTSNGGGSQTDWRMPNSNELTSLTERGHISPPPLPSGHPFSNVMSYWYWSSTTDDLFRASAWIEFFGHIGVYFPVKFNHYHIWLVRGGQ